MGRQKPFNVISTKYTAGLVGKDTTYFGGTSKVFKILFSIEKYNQYMGGGDKANQLLEPCDPSTKSHAWFKKLGLQLVMRMVFNSYLVYKNMVNKNAKMRH